MASKKKMKYTEEEISAMKVNAMLQGLDPNEIKNEELDEEIEIEIEDEKPAKKKKKSSEPLVIVPAEVPMLTQFEKLAPGGKVNVTYGSHDIHYKDQFWGIDTRIVEYNIELVNIQKVARDCSDLINNNSALEREKANSGEVRYMKVVSYLENIPYRAREIGWIKVTCEKNKLKYKLVVNERQLKQNNINAEKLTKNVRKELDRIVG